MIQKSNSILLQDSFFIYPVPKAMRAQDNSTCTCPFILFSGSLLPTQEKQDFIFCLSEDKIQIAS